MNKSLLFAFGVLLALSAGAQVALPNSGFENWTSGEPDHWNTNNVQGTLTPVTISSDAHSGSSAVRGEVELFNSNHISPNLGTYSAQPFPITQQYATLNFFYKMHREQPTDGLVIVGSIYDSLNNVVGLFSHKISTENSAYMPASVPILWLGSNPANFNFIISMEDTAGSGSGALGSYYLMDDVSLGGFVSGIEEEQAAATVSVYPNPAATTGWNVFTAEQWRGGTLRVFNVTGQLVYSAVITQNVTLINAGLPKGFYCLELSNNKTTLTRKLSKL